MKFDGNAYLGCLIIYTFKYTYS